MAEENENQDAETNEAEGKSGGGKKILLIVFGGLLFVGIVVVATLYFLGYFNQGEEAVETEAGEQQELRAQAIYYPIKPPFIINYQSRGRQRFLQVSVTVMSRDPQAIEAVQTHLPLLKNQLVMMFGGAAFEDLHTDEGREMLRLKTLTAIQDILTQEIGRPGIEQVLFENFVMQ